MNRISSTIVTSLHKVALNRYRLPCDPARSLLYASRIGPSAPVSCIHLTKQRQKKSKKELSSEPTRFTSSPANIRSMPNLPPESNEYQPLIISFSMLVFFIYFFILREENDIDEELNLGLFDRVPQLEEPHLAQAIPRMKDAGIDTREAERRLSKLREQRLLMEAGNSKK